MIKKYSLVSVFRSAIFIAIILVSGASSAVHAIDGVYDLDFYQSNDILYYHPGDTGNCVVGQGSSASDGRIATGNGANGNKDYKGREIIPADKLEKIKKFQPIYEQASKQTGIPWQVFAVVHIRESNLADYNPSNPGGSQGIYQDYGWNFNEGKPYPYNGTQPVSDAEFLRQTVNAGKELLQKAEDVGKVEQVKQGEPDAIKDMFFGYNGRPKIYKDQAEALGFSADKAYEGSPYVMNKADEKRDPDVQGSNGTWKQYVADGVIGDRAGDDYGAYLMYAALAGVPATSGTCTNGGSLDPRVGANGWATSGPNAMAFYYQDHEPWASKPYGGTIKACGCGPTSIAMAASTLNKNTSMNPEVVANSFAKNGYINEGCGSTWQGYDTNSALAKEFNLSFIEIGTDLSKVPEAVKGGSFVLVSFLAGTPFGGSGGHFMLIRGMASSGNYLFADPNDRWGGESRSGQSLSNKTMNDTGFPASDFEPGGGIKNMWIISLKTNDFQPTEQ